MNSFGRSEVSMGNKTLQCKMRTMKRAPTDGDEN